MRTTVVHLTTVHTPFDNRIFHKQCVSLVEMGYRVVLFVPHYKDEIVQGVEIRALPKPSSRLLRLLITTTKAFRMALREKAEIYHFHDPELIPAGLFLRLLRKNVVYDIHEDYVTSMLHVQRTYLPGPLRYLVSRAIAGVEYICGRFFKKVLAEKYYSKRFPEGVPILNYPKKREFHFAVSGQINGSPPQLLYTGNITKVRGALQHAGLVSKMEDVRIFMVGKCDERLAEELMEIAGQGRQRLYLEGVGRYVPFAKIMEYYKKGGWTAGLALFPATAHYMDKELTKFFEYMAAGIPIICSNFPVWQELMEKTGAGICVDPDNEAAVAQAVQFLAQNPNKAARMGEKGKKAVELKYNWEKEAEKLTNLYESLVE